MGFNGHLTAPWLSFEPSEADNSVTLQKSFKKSSTDDYCRHTEGLFTDCPPHHQITTTLWLRAPLTMFLGQKKKRKKATLCQHSSAGKVGGAEGYISGELWLWGCNFEDSFYKK